MGVAMASEKRRLQRARETIRRRRSKTGGTAKTQRGRLYAIAESIDHAIETHPVARLCGLCFAIFGGLILIGTGIQIMWDYEQRQEDRTQRVEEAISRAWETVLRPVVGNTGKGAALSYLIAHGQRIGGLDLSCKNMSRYRSDDKCQLPVYISNFDVNINADIDDDAARSRRVYFDNINFDNVIIEKSKIYGVVFRDIFSSKLEIRSSRISSSFQGKEGSDRLYVQDTFASESSFSGFRGIDFVNSIITGSRFYGFRDIRLLDVYAAADNPPALTIDTWRKKKHALYDVVYCDPTKSEMLPADLVGARGAEAMLAAGCNWTEEKARTMYHDAWKDILPSGDLGSN